VAQADDIDLELGKERIVAFIADDNGDRNVSGSQQSDQHEDERRCATARNGKIVDDDDPLDRRNHGLSSLSVNGQPVRMMHVARRSA
jgi:hypothetical protein